MVSAEETEKLILTHQIDYLDLGVAKDMALLSNAQYAVYGSFSQAGESISLDTRLVDAHEIKKPKPFFVTKDGFINILPAVDELAARLQSGMLQQDRIASIAIFVFSYLFIFSIKLSGNFSKWSNCITYTPRPCVFDLKSVAYPNISDNGTNPFI